MSRGAETIEAQIAALQATNTAAATTSTAGLQPAAQFAALGAPVSGIAGLQAIAASARAEGMIVAVMSDVGGASSFWRFSATSTASDASNSVVVTPTAGSGRWLRMCGAMALTLAVDKTTTDAATIWTCPAGCRFRVQEAWWEVGTNWSGGSSSAIGVHCSVSGWSTKGDILGGAGGDVAATLVTTNTRMTGTVGAKLDAHSHDRLIMVASDTLAFDQITSTFTAGAANVRVSGILLANPGA